MYEHLIVYVLLLVVSVYPIYALVAPWLGHGDREELGPAMMVTAIICAIIWFALAVPFLGWLMMSVAIFLLYRLLSAN